MIKVLRPYCIILASLWLCACLHESQPFLPEPESHYQIEGLEEDKGTKKYLKTIMQDRLKAPLESETENQQTAAITFRERQINADLLKALRAQGYYQGQVLFEEGKQPASGAYKIAPGPLYTIETISIEPDQHTALLNDLPLNTNDPLHAGKVLHAQQILSDKISKTGCALNLNLTHKAVLKPDKTNIHLIFTAESGPDVNFGPITFQGQKSVKTDYLKKLIPWQEGECFQRTKLGTLRKKLLSSGLFSEATVETGQLNFETDQVPVIIRLKERAHRTIQAGLSYYTDEGPGASLSWEHRNFFGHAEKLSAELALSALEQRLDTTLSRPFFRRNDQTLSLHASIFREDTDAYEEIGLGTGFAIQRKFTPHLTGRLGSTIEFSDITEDNGTQNTFGLLSGTVSVVFDNRNSTLDPRKGWYARLQTEPFIDVLGESSPFIKTALDASSYFAINKRGTIAARTKIGSIAGTGANDIPATERFYAGGGGSVRGFGYQEIGPYENNDPVGGRSLIETSLEYRHKFTDKIGAVAFVDAGNVSDNIMPDVTDFSVGAGLGLRYHTNFGPLRLDIATPLNNDDRLDQNYQIYISIGQAF